MDKSIAHIQEEVPWYMLFAVDILFVDESIHGVNAELARWWEALQSKSRALNLVLERYNM